jgi:hypothetical protein
MADETRKVNPKSLGLKPTDAIGVRRRIALGRKLPSKFSF